MARKILLADDSVTAQNMGRRILSEAGYEVITVNNGSAAIKKIAEHKPDLVILDVYMPGYGGLEVCQRLKEAAETLSIPVLLTVGKLEPFKADEARRVHADAHLIKPFEASELLNALTKLEDKIVPQADSQDGKIPVTFTRAEPGRKKDFGDSMTGWKNRLTIPSSPTKPEEPEAQPEGPRAAAIAFRNFNHPADSTQEVPHVEAAGTAESIYNGMVQDITAEEIAAIAAAAEAFGEKLDVAEAEPPSVAVSAAPVEEVPTGIERAAQDSQFEAPESSSHETEAAGSYAALVAHAEEHAAVSSASDDEVVAALESLAPTPSADPSASSEPKWVAQEIPLSEGEGSFILEREMQKVFAALAAVEADRAAEEAAGEEPVSRRVLDSSPAAGVDEAGEVHVAIEAHPEEQTAPEAAHVEPESVHASLEESPAVQAAVEEIATGEAVAEPPQVESVAISEPVVEAAFAENEQLAEPAAESALSSEERWSEDHLRGDAQVIAERSVDAIAGESRPEEQAAQQPVAEAQQPQTEEVAQPASADAARPERPLPDPTRVEAVSAEAVGGDAPLSEGTSDAAPVISGKSEAEPRAEAAYAAAASAGAGFGSINAISSAESTPSLEGGTESVAVAESAAPAISVSAVAAPEREAELAAAWAQWRQIRETIGKPAEHSPAEASAPAADEVHSPEPVQAEPLAPSGGASDPTAIASIVESMLAELRPRLVEEIAKKLGKEPK